MAIPAKMASFGRRVRTVLTLVALAAALAPVAALAQTTILTPGTSGDQLMFVYDATGRRVPFIAVTNLAETAIVVETAFYGGQNLDLITAEVRTIPARGNLPVIDPTDAARFPGVSGTAGLVVVTPIASPTDTTPVVPPAPSEDDGAGPLFGGFTLANLDLGAAVGQNPFARLAVQKNGERPVAGTVVDGTVVAYQRIAPDVLTVPFYFNPQTLAPPENDGNRIILATFTDTYGTPFRIGAPNPATAFDYAIVDAAGMFVVNTSNDVQVTDPITVNGVAFTNLQSLAGPVTLTSSGKVIFVTVQFPLPPSLNLFGVVSQAVGTFAVGQVMPGGNSVAPATSAKRGIVPCTDGGTTVDVYAFPVQSGETLSVSADLPSAAGGNLVFDFSCVATRGNTQFQQIGVDDTGACTVPISVPNSCPQYTFTASASGVCTVALGTSVAGTTTCPQGFAEYELSVSAGRVLTQIADNQTP